MFDRIVKVSAMSSGGSWHRDWLVTGERMYEAEENCSHWDYCLLTWGARGVICSQGWCEILLGVFGPRFEVAGNVVRFQFEVWVSCRYRNAFINSQGQCEDLRGVYGPRSGLIIAITSSDIRFGRCFVSGGCGLLSRKGAVLMRSLRKHLLVDACWFRL